MLKDMDFGVYGKGIDGYIHHSLAMDRIQEEEENRKALMDEFDNDEDNFDSDDLDFDEISRVINVNAIGTLRVTNALSSLVLNSTEKTIVNISSEAGSIADCWRTGWCGYWMSKAANNMQSALVHTDLTQRQATGVPLTEF